MLNNFKINYKGVEIVPTIRHKALYDVLCYYYEDKRVEVTFDYTMYDSSLKNAYIESIKYVAEQGLRGDYY